MAAEKMAHRGTSPADIKRTLEISDVFDTAFGSLMTGDPDAFNTKFRKMAASPFHFFRGTACLFFHDLREETRDGPFLTEKTGRIWIHGDLHAENFGTYMESSGRLVFNVNDFDEAYIGPFTWDLKRFAASIALIGHTKALSDDQISKLVKAFAAAYRKQIEELINKPDEVSSITLSTARGPLLEALRAARKESRVAMLDGDTHIHGHDRRFSEGSGVIRIDDATRDKVLQAFKSYLKTLPDSRRQSNYYVKDVVSRRGMGIGSAGLPTYNLLIAGASDALEGDVIVYMKESQASAVSLQLNDADAQRYFKHEGHRTVISQRALQAHADPWLGWTEIDGKGYMVTEVSPYGQDIEWSDINDPEEMEKVIADLGGAVAGMHGAADDDSEHSLVPFSTEKAIGEAIGKKGEEFDDYLIKFAHQYGDRTRKDHQLFIDAFRNGIIGQKST